MYTVSIPLNTTEYDRQQLDQRFRLMNKCHNILVTHSRHLIHTMEHDTVYRSHRSEYIALIKKTKLTKTERHRKKELSDLMKQYRLSIGLTQYQLESWISVFQRRHKHLLTSQQCQKEACFVWNSVDKYLFGNGKEIHYRSISCCTTISQKCSTNGVKVDLDTFHIYWLGLAIKIRQPTLRNTYMIEALHLDNMDAFYRKYRYAEIHRRIFPDGWHYYVRLVMNGSSPKQIQTCDGVVGIDPGVSTEAVASTNGVILEELAPKCKRFNQQMNQIQRRMDASQRKTNPEYYNEAGTIISGPHHWKHTQQWYRLHRQLQTLHRQKHEYTVQSHQNLANRVLKLGNCIYAEKMRFQGLAKRSRNTERQDKVTVIKRMDGTTQAIHKYKRKRRFGKSVNDRSPGLFLTILQNKVESCNGHIYFIDTETFKASQYDHVADAYTQVPLSKRDKCIQGLTIQRDLYSAFLISCSDDSHKHADRALCNTRFNTFVHLHDVCIQQMKQQHVSYKACFGF